MLFHKAKNEKSEIHQQSNAGFSVGREKQNIYPLFPLSVGPLLEATVVFKSNQSFADYLFIYFILDWECSLLVLLNIHRGLGA